MTWSFTFLAKQQSVTFRFRNFSVSKLFQFFWWYWYRFRKFLVSKKVLVSVPKKFGIKKSIGIGFEIFWYRKSISIGFEIFWQWKVFSGYKLVLLNILFQVLSNPLRLLHTDSFPWTSLSSVLINKDSWRWVGYILVVMMMMEFFVGGLFLSILDPKCRTWLESYESRHYNNDNIQ